MLLFFFFLNLFFFVGLVGLGLFDVRRFQLFFPFVSNPAEVDNQSQTTNVCRKLPRTYMTRRVLSIMRATRCTVSYRCPSFVITQIRPLREKRPPPYPPFSSPLLFNEGVI